MKTLTISNVFLHESLELDIPPGPTLITGENSAGKTSVARILAAVTTHHANPARLSAALTKSYVRRGAVEGYAKLSDGATWILPNKMDVPMGLEPETGPHMAGIIEFVGSTGASAADRAAIYESLFLPSEPMDLLRPIWKQSDQQLETVVKWIKEKGWKAAFNLYDEQKKDAGRKWGDITGKRYTKKRGATWRPDDWQSDLEGLSEDDVLTALTEAQDALRAAGVQHAVEQERIDRGVEARDEKVPEQESEVTRLKEAAEAAREALKPLNDEGMTKRKALQDHRSTVDDLKRENVRLAGLLEVEDAGPPHSCPWCDEGLRIDVDGIPVRWEPTVAPDQTVIKADIATNEAKIAEAVDAMEAAKKEFDSLSERYNAKRDEADELSAQHNQALGVLREYRRQAQDAELTVTQSNDAVRSALENERDRADARRKAWIKVRDAQIAHENYVEYEMIATILGPTGARSQHMKKHMDRLRKALESISNKTGWKAITITDAYEVVSGGYPAVLLDVFSNERRKVQWAIQAAITMLTPSAKWLILDAADLVKGESWEGLEALVAALSNKREDLHIVVCAAETYPPQGWNCIDLSEAA